MRTPLARKRMIADKMLAYFKGHSVATCRQTYPMLCRVSEAIGEELPDVWKAYNLLREVARLELNSPNGKKGFRVLDYTSISLHVPDRPNLPICEACRCPVLKLLRRTFPTIEIKETT